MTFIDKVRAEFASSLDLFIKKNADYGSSFELVADEFKAKGYDPMLAMIPRLSDKYGRIVNLTLGDKDAEIDEAVIDTLRDLGTYCFMAAAYISEPSIDIEQRIGAYLPDGGGGV